MAYVGEEMKEMLHFFGYAKVASDSDNSTGFFEYEEEDPELIHNYKAFEAHREQTIDWVCSLNEAELSTLKYQLSDPAKGFNIMSLETTSKACKAIAHYS